MNRYENEICVGCGKPMLDGEDIVVCPECATPQHRECYNKLGSCVNGYLHASGYVWQPEHTPEPESNTKSETNAPDTYVCPFCGEENSPDELHCRSCGNPIIRSGAAGAGFGGFAPQFSTAPLLDGTGLNENDMLGDEKAVDAALYVRRGQKKLLPRFKKFSDAGGKGVSFNWPAFFLAPYYFFYRRMFKAGLAFAGIFVVISLVISPSIDSALSGYYEYMESRTGMTYTTEEDAQQAVEEMNKEMAAALSKLAADPVVKICAAAMVLNHIAAGFLANRLYYKKTLRDIKAVREKYPDERIYKGLLPRVGGVSPLGAISSFFCIDLACSLLASLADYIAK